MKATQVQLQKRALRKLLRRRMKSDLAMGWFEWKENFEDVKSQDRAHRFCGIRLREKAFSIWGQYAIMRQQRRGILHTLIARRSRQILLHSFLRLKFIGVITEARAKLAAFLGSIVKCRGVALQRHLRKRDAAQMRLTMTTWHAKAKVRKTNKVKMRRAILFVSLRACHALLLQYLYLFSPFASTHSC